MAARMLVLVMAPEAAADESKMTVAKISLHLGLLHLPAAAASRLLRLRPAQSHESVSVVG